ncbi:MAG TPA: nitroreductase family deazaflavin-dependent oxidoreductase [Blastocatellia bacterium]|nr:nitroreductase family deazaflavin-dependent oxidoreductase [Blastocatellia bacterium]
MMDGSDQPSTHFMRPSAGERLFNRLFGFLVRMGFGLSHNFMLEVRGRKSGKIYSTPVNVLEHKGAKYLVAPRGYTQWVRNVVANKSASLVKGKRREEVSLRTIPDNEKPEILKAYLDRYKTTVQRYFPIPAGSPVRDFEPLVDRYPVFELTATTDEKSGTS